MSGSSSDSESSHSSQNDSKYNYIPGYIIEEESNDTSYEIGNLEALDREILGDYDACLYADEPLSYKSSNQTFLTCILFYRCKCGHCVITHIQNTHEAWCCQEMESCKKVLNDDLVLEYVPQPPSCITLHPGF